MTQRSWTIDAPAPILDGSLQTFESRCTVHRVQHVRLEEVSIPEGEELIIYAFASSRTEENGMDIRFLGGRSGQISIRHPEVNEPALVSTENLTLSDVYCVDLHIREVPIHVLLWKASDCNLGGISDAFTLNENTLFNSALHTNQDTGNWRKTQNPSGRFFNYKASSNQVRISKIMGSESIFSD